MSSSDVTLVGGGMAGGLLAALLASEGVKVTLLDGAPAPVMPDGEPDLRVSALTQASQRLLASVGAWQRLPADRVAAYQDMAVWDGDGTGAVHFDAGLAGTLALGWMVENRAVVAALYQACGELGVQWRSGEALADVRRADDGWRLRLSNGEECQVRRLVGADGAASRVRGSAGIPAPVTDTGHLATVANLRTEKPHDACARQWFLDSGPVAILPMFGDGHDASLVWSAWPAESGQLMDMDDTAFSEALTRASGGLLGKVSVAGPRQQFPIRNLHASEYVRPGLALVGDAAHVVHPLAGQGINLGLLDSGVLAEEMLVARARGLDLFHDSVLARYQRRRRGHNALMQRSFLAIKSLFEQASPPVRLLRNAGMGWVNRSAFARRHLARAALGLHGDVPAIARREAG